MRLRQLGGHPWNLRAHATALAETGSPDVAVQTWDLEVPAAPDLVDWYSAFLCRVLAPEPVENVVALDVPWRVKPIEHALRLAAGDAKTALGYLRHSVVPPEWRIHVQYFACDDFDAGVAPFQPDFYLRI